MKIQVFTSKGVFCTSEVRFSCSGGIEARHPLSGVFVSVVEIDADQDPRMMPLNMRRSTSAPFHCSVLGVHKET